MAIEIKELKVSINVNVAEDKEKLIELLIGTIQELNVKMNEELERKIVRKINDQSTR